MVDFSKLNARARPIAFEFNADLIRCALAWVWEEGRATSPREKYAGLTFVRVEPLQPGAVIVGTCAHAMFIAYDPEAVCPEPALLKVPASLVEHLKGKNTRTRSIRYSATAVEVLDKGKSVKKYTMQGEEEYLYRGLKAHYANWRSALPTKLEFARANPVIPTVMNADFLGRLSRMFDGWADHRNVYFATVGKPALDPARELPTDARNFFCFFPWKPDALLMFAPMGGRPDIVEGLKYPEWLAEPKKADPADGL